MAVYEFLCTSPQCGGITERVQSVHQELPDQIPCAFCSGEAHFRYPRQSVQRSGSGNEPLDIAIGRNAEARWGEIHQRQEVRDKVRRQNNQVGLAASSYTEFAPIATAQQKVRTRAMDAVTRDGYKPDSDPLSRLVE